MVGISNLPFVFADSLAIVTNDQCQTKDDCPDNSTCSGVGLFGQKECVQCEQLQIYVIPNSTNIWQGEIVTNHKEFVKILPIN